MRFRVIAAIVAATTLLCAPLAAQDRKLSALPNAVALSGGDYLPGIQGAGCSSGVAPCGNVRVQLPQIATYLSPTFEARDADLDAIAALSTTAIGRSLLTQADAAALRSVLGVSATGADTTYLYRANNLSGLTDASAARGNLGLGSIATQAASAVAITGGTISGLSSALSIASGGTGRTSAPPILAASSYSSSGSSIATIGTSFATVILSTVKVDSASCYSTSSGYCTLTEAGTYRITAKIRVADGTSSGVSYGLGMDSANQDSASFFWCTTAPKRNGCFNSRLYTGAAGDQIRLFAYADQSLSIVGAEMNIDRVR